MAGSGLQNLTEHKFRVWLYGARKLQMYKEQFETVSWQRCVLGLSTGGTGNKIQDFTEQWHKFCLWWSPVPLCARGATGTQTKERPILERDLGAQNEHQDPG